MKTLLNTSFFKTLNAYIRNDIPINEEQLNADYNNFLDLLKDFPNQEKSRAEILRCLNFTCMEMKMLLDALSEKNNSLLREYITKALFLVCYEKKITVLRIKNPSFEKDFTPPLSPLYWSKELSKTDLIEILSALDSYGAIRNEDGSQADFSTIVRVFERVLNINIKYPAQARNGANNRKLRTTHFLDLLRKSLMDFCQR